VNLSELLEELETLRGMDVYDATGRELDPGKAAEAQVRATLALAWATLYNGPLWLQRWLPSGPPELRTKAAAIAEQIAIGAAAAAELAKIRATPDSSPLFDDPADP